MECAACHERGNPPDARFCVACAAPLARRCAACGAELPLGARFCPQCAHPAETPAPEPPGALGRETEAERRQLTVLFCDLVDSTRLAAGLDPEDWRELVRRYQEAAAVEVERFEGHVAQYLGDGVLAYFGWPRAHEDDAERAVRAALAIVQAVKGLESQTQDGELRVRLGIHTGPVVVGEIGRGARKETLALGDTTNVAARLQEGAEPGAVVLTSATLRLVQGVFRVEDLGELAFKGISAPVRVLRALAPTGVRSRLDVAAASGLTPLVGREQELMLLEDRWQQVLEGRGHAVLVSGEAGIGKSRLVQAFRERLADRPHTWLECRASPYTQDSPLYPVIELNRIGLGLQLSEHPEERLERLESALGVAGFELSEAVPALAALHSIPLPEGRYAMASLSPEALRKKTLGLLAEWLARLGRLQPVVLLMEDLHWMDPSTLELLGQVLEQVPTEQVLLLLTYRPDFEPPWGAKSHVTPMLLARLTRSQIVDLIRKATRERALPDAWVGEIVGRCDGVPLFAEELVRAVLEGHPAPPHEGEAPALAIPATLQDSLMARLDALGPVKELAQLGAVLGREFTYDLLLAISPMKRADLELALAQAVREELFYQRGQPPEATYLFKHALIRDAAYQSMLRSTRQRHHRRVAETLIQRMPAVMEAQPELVAHHLTESGEVARAIEWWQRAGERAFDRSANREASRQFERGIALVPLLAEGEPRARLELALQLGLGAATWALSGWATEAAERTWRRSLALAEDLRDEAARCVALSGLSVFLITRSELSEGLRFARQLRDLALTERDLAAELAGWNGIVAAHMMLGELDRACTALDEFLKRDPELQVDRSWTRFGWSARVGPRSWGAVANSLRGHRGRALALSQENVALARRTGHAASLCFALAFREAVLINERLPAELIPVSEELIALAEDQYATVWISVGRLARAWARAVRGEPVGPLVTESQSALALGGSSRNLATAPFSLWCHADTLRCAGQHSEALQFVDGALAFTAQIRQPFYDAALHHLKGELLLALEGRSDEEAEAELQRALEIARAQNAKSFELRAATSLARLWRDRGKRTEARDLLAPIHAWFAEGFDTPDLVEAKALLVELRA